MANRGRSSLAPRPRGLRAAGALPRLWLSLALAVVAGGCGDPAGTAGAPPADKLEIRQPRATLTPHMGAVYLTVVNPGPGSDRLLRVETAAARRAETHETLEENGVMRMVPRPEGFEVPAGGTLELKPGGKHIMLVEPQEPARGKIGLTLHFERAGAVQVEAELSAMGEAGHP